MVGGNTGRIRRNSLYGLTVPCRLLQALASACAENAVLFTSMGMWKNIFAPGGLDGDPNSHSLYQLYLFGALSGVFTCLAMCPAEVVKVSCSCVLPAAAGWLN